MAIGRPESGEYKPYQEAYVKLVPAGEIVDILERERRSLVNRLRSVSPERAIQPIAPGKWTVNQMLGHISDTERVFAYRALSFARGDRIPLPGFEQDDYAREAGSNDCSWDSLIEEFDTVRRASVLLFRHLPAAAWLRTGTANEGLFTVRAIAYVIAGHGLYHAAQLEQQGII
jgi:hypothetical protein